MKSNKIQKLNVIPMLICILALLSNSIAKNIDNSNYSILLDTTKIIKNQERDNCDALLRNIDLRSYRFKYDTKGYYQEIIRLTFSSQFHPFSFEVGLVDSTTFDVFVKYGTGDMIKFNKFPYRASEIKVIPFYLIDNTKCKSIIKELFNLASNLKPNRSYACNCALHTIEYRNDSESEDAYYKFKIWNKPDQLESMKILNDFYSIIFELLHQKGIVVPELSDWEDLLLFWNDKKPKRPLRDQ
jgi:hypothetical protein